MKIWQKKKLFKNGIQIKKYKLMGLTVFKKEKSTTKKKYKLLGITIKNKKRILPTNNQTATFSKATFPENTTNCYHTFDKREAKFKRNAIFASFSNDGKIHDYVIYYLKELKKICDNIVFVTDNPIFSDEIQKIKNIVFIAKCQRHEEYDFGSYKYGYLECEKYNLLNETDELIVCNDSCYGPIYPFQKLFDKMQKQKCDFWGLTQNDDIATHIQSFFYVFKKDILKTNALKNFLMTVKKEESFWNVVLNYEISLTSHLNEQNFKHTSFIPQTSKFTKNENETNNKTIYPLTLTKNYEFPLIKVKTFNNGFGTDLKENPDDVLTFLKSKNIELYNIILNELNQIQKK